MVVISKNIERQIRYIGEKNYPNKGGGLLLGVTRDGVKYIKETLEIMNSSELYRDQRYYITPAQYRDAERKAKYKNLELLGLFHSNPNSPATPSQYDHLHAQPAFVYVFVSVHGGRSSGVSSWVMTDNRQRFEQKQLQVMV
jgi:proteasome lid subunit RPN8/RPN11